MPFRVKSFAGDALPDFVQRSDMQDMGNGVANVDMVRLPGGNYYDNYGDKTSPRVSSRISKRCEIHATGGATVREQVEAWRARLGEVGPLEVEWHDGEIRWVYARFTEIRHPRSFATAATFLPVEFAFMPRVAEWFGETQTVDVTSWSSPTTDTLVTVANDGSVPAAALLIEMVIPTTGAINLTLENYATSQLIELGLGVFAGSRLVIDTDRRTVRAHEVPVNLDSISRSGNVISVETASAHGFSIGNTVEVLGTDYDGLYEVLTVPTTDTLTLAADRNTRQPHGPQAATGTIGKVTDAYTESGTVFSDPARWLWLVPGDNDIHITSDEDLDGGSITFTFYPTYG